MLLDPLSPRQPLKACRLSPPPFRTISTSLASPPSRATLWPPPLSAFQFSLLYWTSPYGETPHPSGEPICTLYWALPLHPPPTPGFPSAVWGHLLPSRALFSFPGPLIPPGQAIHPLGAILHLQDLNFFTALPKVLSTFLFCFVLFLTICKWEFSFTLQWLFYTYSFF